MQTHIWKGRACWYHRTDYYGNQGALNMYLPCNTISVLHQANDSTIIFTRGEMAK